MLLLHYVTSLVDSRWNRYKKAMKYFYYNTNVNTGFENINVITIDSKMSLTLSKAEIKRLAEEKEKLEAIKKQIQIEILRPGDASNFPKKGIDYI